MSDAQDPSVDPSAGTSSDGGSVSDACSISNADDYFGLRIGSIFVILVTSLIGTLMPIIFRTSKFVPRYIFDFAKFFGSGVIIATAFIHLLAPAFEELGSPCLEGVWEDYDWAPAIAMAAVYGIFFAEIAAYRIGTKKLERLGVNYSSHNDDATDAHAHSHAHDPPINVDTSSPETPHHIHPSASRHLHDHDHPESPTTATSGTTEDEKARGHKDPETTSSSDLESVNQQHSHAEGAAQLIGVAVLEFGVILHSVIIGLTLAVNESFITLFIVIIFHQMFEGLGLGSRLAALNLPKEIRWARYAAAVLYSICTPIGIAIGLAVRESLNTNGVAMNITSGVLDALSAGILLYTGLVELMAHEILLNPRMMKSSNKRLTFIFCCMLLGSGLMALLGRWA